MLEHIRHSNLIEGIDNPDEDLLSMAAWEWLIGTVATQPKNSAQNAIIYDSWADQWNCALCRTISDFCPLHASLNADGVKPPQSIWGKS